MRRLGQHGDARRHGIPGTARTDFAAVDPNRARCDPAGAEDRFADLRPPGAEQARQAHDLAVAQRKRCRGNPVGGEVADLERERRIGGRPAGIGLEGKLAPDHQPDELLLRHLRRLADAGDAAILHDRHPVGDLEDLGHAVRDIDDRNPLRGEAPDGAEKMAALVDGQRRGRLVEDEQLQLVREALGDLDHLLLARR